MIVYWRGKEHSSLGTLYIIFLNEVDESLIQQLQQLKQPLKQQEQRQKQQYQWISIFLWLMVN